MARKIKNFIYKKLGRFYFKIKNAAKEFEKDKHSKYNEFLSIMNQNFNAEVNQKRFIFFDYKFHNFSNHCNLGDFIQSIATYKAVEALLGGGVLRKLNFSIEIV